MLLKPKFVLILLLFLLVAACTPRSQAVPDLPTQDIAPPTDVQPTQTATPTPTATATETPTPSFSPSATQIALPSPTFTPFPGFGRNFKFYQAWTKEETTWFYFMSAYVDQTVYALVDDLEGKTYALTCPQDKTFPQDLRCYSDELFKGKSEYKVIFFSDPQRQHPFFEQIVESKLDTRYLTYDNCEKEYRIYDGRCYSAITCYGENGQVVYTYDDIPYGGNFEGYSLPCR